MDECLLLTGGGVAYRQQAQRDLWDRTRPRQATALGRRVRTALATALVALAARLAPAEADPAKAQRPFTTTSA